MTSSAYTTSLSRVALVVAAAVTAGGCASHEVDIAQQSITTQAPFSRNFQPDPKLNVTYHLQTTCADNRDGSSIVFVTAEREDSRLQKMKQTTSVGVGPATLTMPSGSAQVLGVVRRETVKAPAFYDRFFSLVQSYVDQEQQRAARERRPHDERHAEVRSDDAEVRNDR